MEVSGWGNKFVKMDHEPEATPRNELRIIDTQPPGLFGRLGGLGEAVVELIVDRDLRR